MIKFPYMREARFWKSVFCGVKGQNYHSGTSPKLESTPQSRCWLCPQSPPSLFLEQVVVVKVKRNWNLNAKVCQNVHLRKLWQGCGQAGGAASHWWTGSGSVTRPGLDTGGEEQRAIRWTHDTCSLDCVGESGEQVSRAGHTDNPYQANCQTGETENTRKRRGNRGTTPTAVNRRQNMGRCGDQRV